MLQTRIDEQRQARAENIRLREELEPLRAANARLREENHELRTALDTHVARAGSCALFGPLELTAGTSVGPRRGRPSSAAS